MTPAERLGAEFIKRGRAGSIKPAEGTALIQEAIAEEQRQDKLRAYDRLATDIGFLVRCKSQGSQRQIMEIEKLIQNFGDGK